MSEDRPIEEQVSGDKKLGSEGERKKDRGVRPQENNLGSIPISNQALSEGLGELEQSQCMEPVNSEERLVTGESSYSIVQIIALKEQNSQTGLSSDISCPNSVSEDNSGGFSEGVDTPWEVSSGPHGKSSAEEIIEQLSSNGDSNFSPGDFASLASSLELQEQNDNPQEIDSYHIQELLNWDLNYEPVKRDSEPKSSTSNLFSHHPAVSSSVDSSLISLNSRSSYSSSLLFSSSSLSLPSQTPVTLVSSAGKSISSTIPLDKVSSPPWAGINKYVDNLRGEVKTLESTLRAESKEREEAFYQILNKSLSSIKDSLSERLSSFESMISDKMDNQALPVSEQNSDDEDVTDVSDSEQPGPSIPPPPPSSFKALLSHPHEELWEGTKEGDFFHFVDNVGFGWSVDLRSEKFEIMDEVFDISEISRRPRNRYMKIILSRMQFEPQCLPLYLLDRPGTGVVKIKETPHSSRIVQIVDPWELQVFDDFVSPPGLDPDVRREEPSNPTLGLPNQEEGSERNWTRIMEFWRKELPEVLQEIFPYVIGTDEVSESPETVFQKSKFFLQGMRWLTMMAKGTVSVLGKETFAESPLPKGRWLPNCANKHRRFYKHGNTEHFNLTPSDDARQFLKYSEKEGYDSKSIRFNSSLSKSLG